MKIFFKRLQAKLFIGLTAIVALAHLGMVLGGLLTRESRLSGGNLGALAIFLSLQFGAMAIIIVESLNMTSFKQCVQLGARRQDYLKAVLLSIISAEGLVVAEIAVLQLLLHQVFGKIEGLLIMSNLVLIEVIAIGLLGIPACVAAISLVCIPSQFNWVFVLLLLLLLCIVLMKGASFPILGIIFIACELVMVAGWYILFLGKSV